MPRGRRRTEVEKLQSQLGEMETKLQRIQAESSRIKKERTQIEKNIDKQIAQEIAKVCRAKNVPLQSVLEWVNTQPDSANTSAKSSSENVNPSVAAQTPTANKKSPRKSTNSKPAAPKSTIKKAASKKTSAKKATAKTKSNVPVNSEQEAPAAEEAKETP